MRTTIEFDDDTSKAIDRLRLDTGMGASEAVNHLIRRGLLAPQADGEYRPIRRRLGLHNDVSNIADAIESLEGADAR